MLKMLMMMPFFLLLFYDLATGFKVGTDVNEEIVAADVGITIVVVVVTF